MPLFVTGSVFFHLLTAEQAEICRTLRLYALPFARASASVNVMTSGVIMELFVLFTYKLLLHVENFVLLIFRACGINGQRQTQEIFNFLVHCFIISANVNSHLNSQHDFSYRNEIDHFLCSLFGNAQPVQFRSMTTGTALSLF